MKFFYSLMLAMIALNLAACGNKGKLKSPTQIEQKAAKKKAKADKQQSDDEDTEESTEPSPSGRGQAEGASVPSSDAEASPHPGLLPKGEGE